MRSLLSRLDRTGELRSERQDLDPTEYLVFCGASLRLCVLKQVHGSEVLGLKT